jgi:hypothetical protein
MSREKLIGLGRLNAYQIAGLSVVTSTVAALAVLFSVRRFLHRSGGVEEPALAEAHQAADKPHVQDHFSENLLVRDITHTGAEILAEDGRKGRSSEGV